MSPKFMPKNCIIDDSVASMKKKTKNRISTTASKINKDISNKVTKVKKDVGKMKVLFAFGRSLRCTKDT